MNITPDSLQSEFSLTTAATRLDFLSRRDNGEANLNTAQVTDDDDGWASLKDTDTNLDVYEALELLALGEVVSRKAHDSQMTGIRAALRGGASWEQVADALGVTPQQAWDSFSESIGRQLEPDAAESVRELAGARPAR